MKEKKEKKQSKNLLLRILSALLILGLLAVCALFGVDAWVRHSVKDRILTEEEAAKLSDVDCILVLGCLVKSDGVPSDMLHDRLQRGVELYDLGDGTYVADTPGFSSFDTDQMDVILKENLQYAFPDFREHLGSCQFHDCTHRKEPGCAVRQAVEDGHLEQTRYDSYLRLYEKASQIKAWELK